MDKINKSEEEILFGAEVQDRVYRLLYDRARKHNGEFPKKLRLNGNKYWAWIRFIYNSYYLRPVEWASGYKYDTAFKFMDTIIYTRERPYSYTAENEAAQCS